MDLSGGRGGRRRECAGSRAAAWARGAVGTALALLLGACSSSEPPFELGNDAIVLPATMLEAYRLANSLALEVSDRAYVTTMGGGFTLMNRHGEARHHSFVFHARESIGVSRRVTVHLIGGAAWVNEGSVSGPPPPFADFEELVDSDLAVTRALAVTDSINATTDPDIPLPLGVDDENAFTFAAKILSVPQWPEPNSTNDDPEVAWRVDFLTEMVAGGGSVPVPWSIARFYFKPGTLELLGDPIVQTELYPWP